MTVKQVTKQQAAALDRLIEKEVARQDRVDAERQQREAEAEAEAERISQAQTAYDNQIDHLRKQLADVTSRQTAWRKRFEALLAEIESLSDGQDKIQTEIQTCITDIKNAVYHGRTNGAMVSAEQTAWDGIGGDSENLRPFAPDIINNPYFNVNRKSNIAALIYPKLVYRPDRQLDGRRRV